LPKKNAMKKIIFLIAVIAAAFAGCEKEVSIREEGVLVPKTVEFDASLPAADLNGTRLHTETFGNPTDPMVVVLHGGPGSDYRSLLNARDLAGDGYYVVFYDQRGSGLSKREPRGSYTIQIMLDDLSAIIAHYRSSPQQKVFLLGHSWGAILAAAYLNEYPAAIQGAILAEPGGLVWQDIMDYVGRARDYSLTSETLNDATYFDQFITGGQDDHAVLDYKFALMASSDGAKDNPIGDEAVPPFWRSGAVVNGALFDLGKEQHPDWTTHLDRYTTPILFCYSERNSAYGQAYAEHVSSAFPSVRLERIDDAGHDMLSFPAGWNHFYPLALDYLNAHR
jgi:proline iminopeptidase